LLEISIFEFQKNHLQMKYSIKLFESKKIRTVWNEIGQKWYFVVEDVVFVLTDSKDPKQYIKRMRQRDKELAKGWVQIVPTLCQSF
jgi:DNA-damage-inducible protein D